MNTNKFGNRIAAVLVVGLGLMSQTVEAAKLTTKFIDVSPLTRTAVVKNGSYVTFTARLVAGGGPVRNAQVTVYVNKAPAPVFVRTDGSGRFSCRTQVMLPANTIPPQGRSIVWAADYGGDGTHTSTSTLNYIHGWGIVVRR